MIWISYGHKSDLRERTAIGWLCTNDEVGLTVVRACTALAKIAYRICRRSQALHYCNRKIQIISVFFRFHLRLRRFWVDLWPSEKNIFGVKSRSKSTNQSQFSVYYLISASNSVGLIFTGWCCSVFLITTPTLVSTPLLVKINPKGNLNSNSRNLF